jgi:carbon storage regulator CsrA
MISNRMLAVQSTRLSLAAHFSLEECLSPSSSRNGGQIMLVLSRKENERLVFPTLDISVEVMRIQGNRTRLGIDAPPDVLVLRQEIANLKGIAFTPDKDASSRKLSTLAKTVRHKLNSSVGALNLLHEHLDGDDAAQSLVLDAFKELRELDREVNEALADDMSVDSPQALVINSDSNEKDLLASCLRIRGFEVHVASNVQDAIGFLSLHASPTLAIVTNGLDAAALRREAGKGMKLIGLGLDEPTIHRSFPRPLNAERLVDELAREFAMGVSA